MPDSASRSAVSLIRYGAIAVLGLAAILMVAMTWKWPLFWDAQVFHYGNFLIAHGFVPYRDIVDMNMPGAYLFDAGATKLFGESDLGWKMFDFLLLGSLSVAMIVIARPYDWLAGWFASVTFALIHSSEGPQNTGQREEIIAVLLMLGCASLFEARRRQLPWLNVFFGACVGMACSIKPTYVLLGGALFVLAAWEYKYNKERIGPFALATLSGVTVAAAIVARFLSHPGSAAALVSISRELTPFYANMERVNFHLLLRFALPIEVWGLLALATGIALSRLVRLNWEQAMLLLCAAFGAFSYFLQGKGYGHHRYTVVAFLLLWIGLQFCSALQGRGWVRIAGLAGLCIGSFYVVPHYLQIVRQVRPVNTFVNTLQQDLSSLGGDRLQGKVQCLDLVDGCYAALYHLKIVQSTGWMGDLLLFAEGNDPVMTRHRERFWNAMHADPPSVIVLSNEDFNNPPTFSKLNAWPAFADYLAQHYRLLVSRVFASEQNRGYRIYVRDGASLPPQSGAD